MRVFLIVTTLSALLAAGVVVRASPVGGNWATTKGRERVDGGQVASIKMTFKGGERACVIVIGDHKPVVRLRLRVEDAKGNLIGEDNYGGDFCTVIWYPPRDGDYRIKIAVPSIGGEADYNDLYIAVK